MGSSQCDPRYGQDDSIGGDAREDFSAVSDKFTRTFFGVIPTVEPSFDLELPDKLCLVKWRGLIINLEDLL